MSGEIASLLSRLSWSRSRLADYLGVRYETVRRYEVGTLLHRDSATRLRSLGDEKILPYVTLHERTLADLEVRVQVDVLRVSMDLGTLRLKHYASLKITTASTVAALIAVYGKTKRQESLHHSALRLGHVGISRLVKSGDIIERHAEREGKRYSQSSKGKLRVELQHHLYFGVDLTEWPESPRRSADLDWEEIT